MRMGVVGGFGEGFLRFGVFEGVGSSGKEFDEMNFIIL